MVRKILYGVATLVAFLLAYLVFNYFQFSKTQKKLAFSEGTRISTHLKDDVNAVLTNVISQGRDLKSLLENQELSATELDSIIIHRSKQLNEILGITVAFEPYAFSENKKLYAPYYDKNQDRILRIGELYDYTDKSLKTSSWYTNVAEKGAHWVEPYYAQAAKTLVADYSLPFYYKSNDKNRKMRGVVTMTISLKGFTEMIHSLSLGKAGFGFVASSKGILLAHPVNKYIGRKSVNDLVDENTPEELEETYQNLFQNKSGNTTFSDPLKNQKALVFYETVPSAKWKIVVLFYKNDLIKNQLDQKRKIIDISLAFSLLFIILLAIFYARDYLSSKEIWYLSFFSTVILLANIVLSGYLEHTSKIIDAANESPPITDQTSLNTIINSQQLKAKNLKIPPKRIVPTGIYIDRLQFEDSYDVNISGTLWQKYDNEFANKVTLGFKFPQIAPFAESSLIEEAYREQKKDYLLVGYTFRTTLRLNFDYSDFPFDKRNINLEIQPINPIENLLLTPDLESYAYTIPSHKSGVNSLIKLSGSKILETYFSYSFFTYDSNFGFENNEPFQDAPKLHFNINVREVLITAFVTYLIPIFVTLIMMFILIYATQRSKKGRVDSGAIVQGMTAFFFVLIFSHIDLRKNIQTADIIFMEYFYFITYAMIILTTYNLINYSRIKHRIFDYRENIIVKATFLPLFLLMVLIIMLFKFY